jgi:hypothetical protein
VCVDTLVPVAPIETGVSTSFLSTGASGAICSSQATLKASYRAVLLEDDGFQGPSWVTDRRKFRTPNVHFMLKDHQNSELRHEK